MEIHINKISKKLKILREEHNLTQEELAKNLGVTRQSIISLEQGRCLPSLPLAISFSRVFELPFEEIFIEEMQNIHREVEDLLIDGNNTHTAINDVFEENHQDSFQNIFPKLNIIENADNIIIFADLPGVSEEDLNIEAGDESLIIKGNRELDDAENRGAIYHQEIKSGNFSRTIPLPSQIEKEKTTAKLKDGVLTIKLYKKLNTDVKVTKIKIQRG
jgi:HSP20 family protein